MTFCINLFLSQVQSYYLSCISTPPPAPSPTRFSPLPTLICLWKFESYSYFWHAYFSIYGENKHYGTPTNPAAPERVPGGSSSGAAVAVAADIVDFSLGNQLVILWSMIILP